MEFFAWVGYILIVFGFILLHFLYLDDNDSDGVKLVSVVVSFFWPVELPLIILYGLWKLSRIIRSL